MLTHWLYEASLTWDPVATIVNSQCIARKTERHHVILGTGEIFYFGKLVGFDSTVKSSVNNIVTL